MNVGGTAGGDQGPLHQVAIAGEHTGSGRTADLQPVALAHGELVGQVDGDHLRIQEVVAVMAHARDPQRQRQLGESEEPGAGDHAASLPHAATSSSSARASGAIPAPSKAAGSTSPASARRSILRLVANPARTSGQTCPGGPSTAGAGL